MRDTSRSDPDGPLPGATFRATLRRRVDDTTPSAPGKGSKHMAETIDETPKDRPRPPRRRRQRKFRVLVVDDEIADDTVRELNDTVGQETKGLTSRWSGSHPFNAARELLLKEDFDVVVLDVMRQRKDGGERPQSENPEAGTDCTRSGQADEVRSSHLLHLRDTLR